MLNGLYQKLTVLDLPTCHIRPKYLRPLLCHSFVSLHLAIPRKAPEYYRDCQGLFPRQILDIRRQATPRTTAPVSNVSNLVVPGGRSHCCWTGYLRLRVLPCPTSVAWCLALLRRVADILPPCKDTHTTG